MKKTIIYKYNLTIKYYKNIMKYVNKDLFSIIYFIKLWKIKYDVFLLKKYIAFQLLIILIILIVLIILIIIKYDYKYIKI